MRICLNHNGFSKREGVTRGGRWPSQLAEADGDLDDFAG